VAGCSGTDRPHERIAVRRLTRPARCMTLLQMDQSAHRSLQYRRKAVPRQMLRRVLRGEQAKIYRRFAQSFPPRPDWRVLEVGTNGSLEDARDYFLQSLYPYPEQITAAGLEEPDVFERVFPDYTYVQVQRHAPLPFDDQSFDLVFSNAVIEHAGTREQQRAFLDELLRVGRRAFVTTPNRRHPIEFHTATPLLHYLPPAVYRRIYAAAGFHFFSKEENLNLFDAEELLALLPPEIRDRSELDFHRFLGVKSNLLLSVRAKAE
jgi:SAM-dependent methyltransferase